MVDTQLIKIKRRLGIEENDTKEDQLLIDVLEEACQAFKALTGDTEVPETYSFIVMNVALKLYNRKGSEGMTAETVDGYSVNYTESLFDEYMDILARNYFHLIKGNERFGRVILY